MSLEEAAVVTGVTALLKSETLIPVNSNLALRLPLSHSVPPPHPHPERTYAYTCALNDIGWKKKTGMEKAVAGLYLETASTVGEQSDGDRKETERRKGWEWGG